MDNEGPSYFQHEYEKTSSRIKSRSNHISVPNLLDRRNSFQRRRFENVATTSQQVPNQTTPTPLLPPQPLHSPPYFREEDNGGGRSTMMSEQQKNNRTIPEKVAQSYYSLGLFCSSHSYSIIILATLVVLISCYPLFSLPFLGNKPKEFVSPYENYSIPPVPGFDEGEWPRWYKGPPAAFIQQVIIKSAITPWSNELLLTDAFRGPLAEVFHVVDLMKQFQLDNNSVPFSQLCFSVGEVKSRVLKGKVAMLPEFGCLMVSPADFWQQRQEKFREDSDVLATILNYQSTQKGRSGLAEILLGMSVRDTGFKRFPLKARPRVVSYAVTFVLQTFDSRYINGLRKELTRTYPPLRISSPPELNSSSSKTLEEILHKSEFDEDLNMIHVFYPSQSSIFELIPLVVTYLAMFIYVYFSVKKIDIITSKLGIAISALSTVVASLCMSVGLCSHFGMTFEVNAKAIYPYLVVIIGLENILVLTRSVVSTAKNLDVKIRVAQGLSKEGWGITKNLLTEITILTIGFFTFMPAIQEFCILAIVGLLSDFFLQTFFFATVLSVDIHRQKFAPDSTRDLRYAYPPLRTPIHPSDVGGIQRVQSSSQIINSDQNGTLKKSQSGISIVAPSHNTPILVKIPKRLQLVYFWARTRFFQRTFTIFMIGWISIIIYESGIVARFSHEPDDVALPLHQASGSFHPPNNMSHQTPLNLLHSTSSNEYTKPLVFAKGGQHFSQNNNKSINNNIHPNSNKLLRDLYSHNPYIWRRLTPYHWQVLFGVYNITLTGKYITILPSICISVPIQPKTAIAQRHPSLEFQHAKRFNWQALANAFDAMDMGDEYDANPTVSPLGKPLKKGIISDDDDPYIPSSPVELALTVLLAIPSIIFIGYLVVVLYKCICSRNYAEWRSSWTKVVPDQDHYTQVVFEAVPLVLDGHHQDVECIGTDGNTIASVCLSGTLKVWHVSNGDNIVTVDRQRYFEQLAAVNDKEDSYCTWVPSDADSPSASSPCEDSPLNTVVELSESESVLNQDFQQQNTQGIPIPTNPSYNNSKYVNNSNSPQASSSYSPNSSIRTGGGHFYSQAKTPEGAMKMINSGGKVNSITKSNRSNSDSLLDSSDPCFPNSSEADRSSGGQRNGNNTDNQTVTSDSALIDDVPAVWCLDCQENLVFLGTGSGRFEVWDALNGSLKCIYEDGSPAGIVCIKVVGNRVILARLSGSLDFLELESRGKVNESPSPYHRWHNTEGDAFSNDFVRSATFSLDAESEIRCVWLMTQKAHQQPITCLECEGGRILTGSQDHTLKVFRVTDYTLVYTLHGHYGPITCLFIDKLSPMTSGSGSQDGMLCVWDLLTGMCMYSIQAHQNGGVFEITYSASYIISVGGDDKICVWERFQGHLLNTIQLDHAYCSSLVMLTQNLLITSKQGSLIVWDVRSAEPVRAVRLGHRDNAVFVRQIVSCSDATILCDYGSQLRLIRFPSVISKYD